MIKREKNNAKDFKDDFSGLVLGVNKKDEKEIKNVLK